MRAGARLFCGHVRHIKGMKNIVVLGSTGSIGRQALDVIRQNRDRFNVIALSAGSNAELLSEQAREFCPQLVCLQNEKALISLNAHGARVEAGEGASSAAAAFSAADVVVNGISGFDGMLPLIAALKAGKTVALANKEGIVCAHTLVDEALKTKGACIVPVDSEQSALFQCLKAGDADEVKRLILTASGGPFRTYSKEALCHVKPQDALSHPTWHMGKKITIDSASLFNKGLEVMEASYLFKIGGERIGVLVHPQSIVHSMVEFSDSSNIAQLSRPDMRLAIQYALSYPARIEGGFGALRLEEVGELTFYEVDHERFPAILLAYAALKEGSVLPIAYNAANEVAAELFIAGALRFTDIARIVERTMARMERCEIKKVSDVLEIDGKARRIAREISAL